MSKFTDSAGREWEIEVSLGMQKRVLKDAEFDLFEADDHIAMSVDPCKIGMVLYSVLQPQIEAAGLSPEEFANGFDGNTCDEAMRALQEALVAFFLKASPAKGRMLEACLSKTAEILEKSSSLAAEKMSSSSMDEIMAKTMAQVDQEMAKVADKTLSE